ncbi:uncharacterized protein LOC143302191 [Babylonia areolata]|uniref:uncharacterized protein LOC143302191 n=1 Tax=Babylonia areolata TaxID=304850 RepID=UPI003FD3905A
MPNSGVVVPDECVKAYNQMKKDKTKICLIFVIRDGKYEVHEQYEKDAALKQEDQYKEIMEKLIKEQKEAYYIVWDLKLPSKRVKSDVLNDTLVYMGLCPDCLPVKARMLFAASTGSLTDKLGVGLKVEIKSEQETQFSDLMEKIN